MPVRLCRARSQRLVVRRSDWPDVVNDVRSPDPTRPDRTGVGRDLPKEVGGLEAPGAVLGLAESTKDEAARSFHVASVGKDSLTSRAVVVDVVNGVLGVGVGVVFGNLRHNGASCCAARQPAARERYPSRGMAAFCYRTPRLILGEAGQTRGASSRLQVGHEASGELGMASGAPVGGGGSRITRRNSSGSCIVPGFACSHSASERIVRT